MIVNSVGFSCRYEQATPSQKFPGFPGFFITIFQITQVAKHTRKWLNTSEYSPRTSIKIHQNTQEFCLDIYIPLFRSRKNSVDIYLDFCLISILTSIKNRPVGRSFISSLAWPTRSQTWCRMLSIHSTYRTWMAGSSHAEAPQLTCLCSRRNSGRIPQTPQSPIAF